MADFYYQIKASRVPEFDDDTGWAWPPLFSGLVSAQDRKAARAAIEEEYSRKFPARILKSDIGAHSMLLHIDPVDPDNDYILRRFRDTACKECGGIFKPIDKYNDPNCDYKGPDYCCDKCAKAGKSREIHDYRLAHEGKLPAVIYQVRQKSTDKAYVGQTTQPFTLRWWQHLTNPSGCKFHEAIKSTPLVDWDFSVLEVIVFPDDCVDKAAFITGRESFWIDSLNSVVGGFNTMRPTGFSPQQKLELEVF